jgi:RNA polymerase-associated protein CTR9
LLNGIGLLHFEKGEFEVCITVNAQYYELSFIPVTTLIKLHFQMAEQSFKEALGDGLWVSIMDGKAGSSMVNWSVQNKDQSFFHQLEEEGVPLELHSNKVTTLFNYARLLEELHDSVRASLFYRFIIFKVLLLLSSLASLFCYTNTYQSS